MGSGAATSCIWGFGFFWGRKNCNIGIWFPFKDIHLAAVRDSQTREVASQTCVLEADWGRLVQSALLGCSGQMMHAPRVRSRPRLAGSQVFHVSWC